MTHKQKKTLTRILITAVLFALLLAMEHTGSFDAWNLSRMQLFILHVIPYLVIGYDVIAKAVKNIRNGQIFDENFLMMIATFAAFAIGEYEEALAVMLFYQTGEWFQSYAVGKSRESIAEMMSIVPEYANRVEADGTVSEEDPEDIAAGDVIIVKPGEKIPLDGEVIEGESWLDTAALTGESVPRRVQTGDSCISGCVNGEGTLRVRVTKAYEDSTVSHILELVENASEKKARLENFITRFARYYTPVVTIGAVLLAVVPPLFFHGPWAEWVKRACVFLIVSCPCALVISVPLGFFGGIGAASGIGVLVKGSNFLEAVSKADTVVFDKTGTLTKGTFAVTALIPAGEAPVPVEQGAATGDAARLLLTYAAYAEAFSNHPVARSIREAYGMEPDLQRLSEATEAPGHGVRVLFDQKELLAGSAKLMQEHGVRMRLPGQEETAFSLPAEAANATGTVVCVAYDGMYRGAVAVSDTVKEGAAKALAQMKAAGVTRTVMLTGDRKGAAESVAASCGIDEVHAELLPADKVAAVESYMKNAAEHASAASGRARTVVFVGDGVNDAPVLMRADVGIAMGAIGSDAAIEAADIVLMDDNIVKIAQVIRIARKTLRIVHQNVAFAIGVKFLVLALGALGLAGMWGAVFADVGVAVLAILNSMRMLRYRC